MVSSSSSPQATAMTKATSNPHLPPTAAHSSPAPMDRRHHSRATASRVTGSQVGGRFLLRVGTCGVTKGTLVLTLRS